MTEPAEYIEAGVRAWAGTMPRRVTKFQRWATSVPEAVELLLDAETDPSNWPFISTYSFPDGHTTDGAVPRIDRLFVDFDVPDDGEYRSGREREDAWVRDMSRLLTRTRKVAKFLLSSNAPGAWQATLSGHKGVHLDLTFPPVDARNGSLTEFKAGLGSYADSIVEYLIDATGVEDLDRYIDVDSSDLGRLRRAPNTKHLGASRAFGEDRFCVPVSLSELAECGPAEYIEYTRSRRLVTDEMRPTPSNAAGEVLTQRVRTATPGGGKWASGGSRADPDRLEAYVEQQNDNITLDNLAFAMQKRPCVLAYIERPDAFSKGGASHLMELFVISHMIERGVPIELEYDDRGRPHVVGGTMVDYFAQHPDYDADYTASRIEQYISRNYRPATCEKVWRQAPTFCLGNRCSIYSQSNIEQ